MRVAELCMDAHLFACERGEWMPHLIQTPDGLIDYDLSPSVKASRYLEFASTLLSASRDDAKAELEALAQVIISIADYAEALCRGSTEFSLEKSISEALGNRGPSV